MSTLVPTTIPLLRNLLGFRRRPFSTVISATLGIVFGLSLYGIDLYLTSPERGLPFSFSFTNDVTDRWTAFGGTWDVVKGSMRNESDDRGAKLVAGSRYWRDYVVDADMQLLGDGDAGLAARVSNAEIGVDSYSGYYAGLRTMDDSLVLGRAEHGWEEYPTKPFPGGVRPFHWYHLELRVRGCEISAVATDRVTGESESISRNTAGCLLAGRMALRSYSSGGLWRNVVVRSLSDGAAAKPIAFAQLPLTAGSKNERSLLASYVSNKPEQVVALSEERAPAQPTGSLRYLSPVSPGRALIRGVVVLTAPTLYVQDASGGVKIEPQSSPSLKIGDEVEAFGDVEPHQFSSVLKNAEVRLLWEGSPGPPLSVTANQAATGAYDAMFIQTEGQLTSKEITSRGTLILDLKRGPQEFRAFLNAGRSASHTHSLQSGSTLRLRGICVVDPAVTRNLTPFVLLVRSSEDVSIIAGPPWWAWSTLLPLGLILAGASGAAYHVYVLAKHWRLRAIVEERGRLAHEIHDTLAQSFAGIGFQLQAIRNSMPVGYPLLEQQVLLACDLVRHSHEEARTGIRSLRPESLESVELVAALEACANKMAQNGDLNVVSRSEGSQRALPPRTTDTLFRIGKEAIANAIRHAQAKSIFIGICYERSLVRLLIQDDGIGFVPREQTRGFGLTGMRKRAESISAELSVMSVPGRGTKVEVTSPLPVKLSLTKTYKYLWQHRRAYERNDPYSYSR
jgi:signal transduction histidine kinase